ncbi:hypothetical protein [Candidatus Tisiphia endosymbiont of Thecophora atra]|uniref:hypothetical protein n=1 Tax=Candidatus Tisiphia endosymbiont of Thecophora atra TaxID=3066258 RepID=UPI00312C7307
MQVSRIFLVSFYIILPSLLTIHFAYASPFNHPETWKKVEISKLLKTSTIHHIEPMRKFLAEKGKKAEFNGEVFLVTLDDQVKAVFKKLPADDLGDAQAEVAAYQASLILGFPHIPPTVMRKINGMTGTLQLYIDTKIDPLVPEEYEKALQEVSIKDQMNLRTFYFIFGQWDSGSHNLLIFKDINKTYFIAIDNSGIRNRQYVKLGELPFVRVLYSDKLNTNDWDKPFPFDKAEVIDLPNEEKLKQRFKKQIPPTFYKNFQSYNHPFRFVIYQNSLWIQYHAFDKSFIISYPTQCYDDTIKAIKKLDLPLLRKIFIAAKGSDFLNNSYLNSILERRDQVLRYCLKIK